MRYRGPANASQLRLLFALSNLFHVPGPVRCGLSPNGPPTRLPPHSIMPADALGPFFACRAFPSKNAFSFSSLPAVKRARFQRLLKAGIQSEQIASCSIQVLEMAFSH